MRGTIHTTITSIHGMANGLQRQSLDLRHSIIGKDREDNLARLADEAWTAMSRLSEQLDQVAVKKKAGVRS